MSKEWKCADCVKFKTDACPTCACGYIPKESCRDVLVDFDYAYGKGRADAIEEFTKKIRELSGTDCRVGCICVSEQTECPYLDCVGDVLEIAEQLKEKNNDY